MKSFIVFLLLCSPVMADQIVYLPRMALVPYQVTPVPRAYGTPIRTWLFGRYRNVYTPLPAPVPPAGSVPSNIQILPAPNYKIPYNNYPHPIDG